MHRLVTRLGVIVTVGLLVLAAGSRADEEKVPLDKVPKVVLDTIMAKYQGAKLIGAEKEKENGKLVYEVALKYKGHSYEVTVTPDGTLVSVEKEIQAKDLPAAVAEAVKAKYATATLKKAEKITKGEKLTYEVVVVTTDGQHVEVVLDPQGKILGEERQGKEGEKAPRKEKKKD